MDRFIECIMHLITQDLKPLKSNMDRFIDSLSFADEPHQKPFKIQYGQIYSHIANQTSRNNKPLKSNMDRFIGATQKLKVIRSHSLKSNMDRFIVISSGVTELTISL